MIQDLIRKNLREIPDFPSKGISYKDITPLLENPFIFKEIIKEFCKLISPLNPDVIVGIESRGFIFSAPIAVKLGKPMSLARKTGKLPYKTIATNYDLEYGTDSLEMHVDSIKEKDKVLIIDDILATGGTCKATCDLVKQLKGTVVGTAFLIELSNLKGKKKLEADHVISLFKA